MKTANVKVREKDIKQGVTIYVAHPVYGIDKYRIKGKPYLHKVVNCMFVDVEHILENNSFNTYTSLRDCGIIKGSSYNGRRTFFKLKQAKEWMDKWVTQKQFKEQQEFHEYICEMDYDDDYY